MSLRFDGRRWRDAKGKLSKTPEWAKGYTRDDRGRWRVRGRFASEPRPPKRAKSRTGAAGRRLERAITEAPKRRRSRAMKQHHAVARAIKKALGVPYNVARQRAKGSLVEARKAEEKRVRMEYVAVKHPRTGKLHGFRSKRSGKVITATQLHGLQERAKYMTAVHAVAARKGISPGAARKLIKERFGGQWRHALVAIVYPKKGK
jgi:hypothetical protein